MPFDGLIRPRRLRGHAGLRTMVAQTRLAASDFVMPLFIREGKGMRVPVGSMPGVYQMSVDVAVAELKRLEGLGVGGYLLFGVTEAERKDAVGSHAHSAENEVCRTLKAAKDAGVGMVAMTDLCYCEYTDHGHCGPVVGGNVDNDATVARLGEQAVLHARCGADVVAPSGMMDGMVGGIRGALDGAGFGGTAILSYAVKYASSFYGPFREAAGSSPGFGDRKGYQMDYRGGVKEALREARLDVEQGADAVMVKPGTAYLDILRAVTEAVEVPTAAYQVSGEYAMVKAAAERGWVDEKGVVLEMMHGFKRAGASFVVTYFARELAGWVSDMGIKIFRDGKQATEEMRNGWTTD